MVDDQGNKKTLSDDDVARELSALMAAAPSSVHEFSLDDMESGQQKSTSEGDSEEASKLKEKKKAKKEGATGARYWLPPVEDVANDFLYNLNSYRPYLDVEGGVEFVRIGDEELLGDDDDDNITVIKRGLFGKKKVEKKRVVKKSRLSAQAKEKIYSRIKNIFALILLTGGGVMSVIYAYVLVSLYNWDGVQENIRQKVYAQTGYELVINSQVDFSAFPLPKFLLKNVILKNREGGLNEAFITVPNLEARLSFFHLFGGEVQISSLILKRPVVNLEKIEGQSANWMWEAQDMGGGLAKKSGKATDLPVSELVVEDAILVMHSGEAENIRQQKLEVESANVKLDTATGEFAILGQIRGGASNLLSNYNISLTDWGKVEPKIKAELVSGTSKIMVDGAIINDSDGYRLEGIFSGVLDGSLKTLGADFENEAVSQFITGILTHDKLTLNGNMAVGIGKFSMENLRIDGEHFKSQLNYKTESQAGNAPPSMSLDVVVDKVDFDAIALDEFADIETSSAFSRKKQAKILKERSGEGDNVVILSPEPGTDVHMAVHIKKATYLGEHLENAVISSHLTESGLEIKSLEIESLPGGGSLRVVDNKTRNEGEFFTGKASINAQSLRTLIAWGGGNVADIPEGVLNGFVMNGAVVLDSKAMHIKKMSSSIDEIGIRGKLTLAYADGFDVSASLILNEIDADIYKKKDVDSEKMSASTSGAWGVFDAFRKLDAMFSKLAVAARVAEYRTGGKKYKNVELVSYFGSGRVSVKKLKFEDALHGKVNLRFDLDNRRLKPEIRNASISVDKFDALVLSDIVKSSKAATITKDNENSVWPVWIINLANIDVFEGDIKIAIKNAYMNNLLLNNLKTTLAFRKGKIAFKKFTARAFNTSIEGGGEVQISGRPGLSMTYKLTNFDVNKAASQLFNYKKLTGKASATGSLSTYGFSIDQLISNLQGRINYKTRGVTIRGFDPDFLGRKLPTLSTIKEVRYWQVKALNSGQMTTGYLAGEFVIGRGEMFFYELPLNVPSTTKNVWNGSLNFQKWQADMKVDMGVKIGGGAVPVSGHITGPIGKADVAWDTRSIEEYWETIFYFGR